MKYIMKVRFSNESASDKIRDPQFGMKMQELLSEVKAEAAYFTTIGGRRGAYVVVNMSDASQMPALAEPFFSFLKAEIDFIPVMTPEDLGKAAVSIQAALKKWG